VLSGDLTPEKVQQLNEMIEELYSLINLASGHNILSDVHLDTREDPEAEDVLRGDLLVGRTTPQGDDRIKWQRLAKGDASTVLRSDGVDPQWDQVQLPGDVDGVLDIEHGGTERSSFTPYAIVAGGTGAATALQQVASLGNSGEVLTSQGAAALPIWLASSGTGRWEPVTDGDPIEAEIVFDSNGDVVMAFVP